MQDLGLEVEIVDGQSDAVAAGTEVYTPLTLGTPAQCKPFSCQGLVTH